MDPRTLKFAESHEWVSLEGDVATVGLSRFAVDQLTDLIMIDLPKPGATAKVGKSFGEIESVKAVSDIYAPLSGEIVEVNGEVAANLQILADDPYGKGWLVKIRASNLEELNRLWDHDTYQKKVAEEPH